MQGVFQSLIFSLLVCSFTSAQDCLPGDIKIENALKTGLKGTYTSGEKLRLNCATGHTGFIKLSCDNGVWSREADRGCKKRPCGHPGDTPNGDFTLLGETEFVYGAKVEYKCRTGYLMVSRENTRHCRSQGWDNSVPICEVVKCPAIQTSGDLIATGNTEDPSFDDVIHFECTSPQLMLDGKADIFCTSSGTWSAEFPKCTEIKCSPPKIAHGKVTDGKPEYKENEMLKYECDEGYKTRRGTPKCLKTGWSITPDCEEKVCLLESVRYGVESTSPTGKNVFRIGETVTITCSEKYWGIFTKQNTQMIKCLDSGEWETPPVCEEIQCDIPMDQHVRNPRYYFSRDRKLGTRVSYYCEDGYKQKATYATCTKNGWTPNPLCEEPGCPELTVENARILRKSERPYKPGARIEYQCLPGYEPEKKFTITCGWDSEWQSVKSCTAKQDKCAAFSLTHGLVQYKKVTDDSSQSQHIYYACEAEYKTLEDTWWGETSCSQGVFSYTPQCISKYDCGHFPTIPHGELNALTPNKVYRHGDWAALQCDLGYKAVQSYITCENGQWTTGECKRDTCGPPPRVENAVVASYNEETYAISATFQCREHFTIPKNPTIFCVKKWDPAPTCEIEKSTCLKPQKEIINGSVLEPLKLKDYYGKMQTVPYKCLEGFSFETETYAQCNGENWTYPNCIPSPQKTEKEKDELEQPDEVDNPGKPAESSRITESSAGRDQTEVRRAGCGRPPLIPHAVQDFKERYEEDEKATYDCPSYYVQDGDAHMVCKQGRWTGNGRCLKPCTVDVHVLDAHNIELKVGGRRKIYSPHNDFITFVCVQGYTHTGAVELRQRCTDGLIPLPTCV
ncbi:complement factor H-like [Hoplias malabaricus]|uniref:complement factor H-like n=1 Tax=Hoplias malabaricus TaxID=27720 RepID=UPI0034626B8D